MHIILHPPSRVVYTLCCLLRLLTASLDSSYLEVPKEGG